jgi:hypothetical protein
MKFRLALAAVLIMLLAGCGFYSGPATVLDKKFTAEHTSIIVLPCGKSICPYPRHHDDSWDVTVEYTDGSKRQATFDVSEDKYNSLNKGDTVQIKDEEELL